MSIQLFVLASDHPAIQPLLESLAIQLHTDFSQSLQNVNEGALVAFDASGELAVQRAGSKEKPIVVDFVGGKAGHRRKFGGGKGQDIARAVGLNKGVKPSVLDATGGLGRDAFVLASLGCNVTMIERSPVVAALLEDGLRRALEDSDVSAIAEQMSLLQGNAIELMKASDNKYDVVYLDPMFPHREKSALVKKEMRLFQDLLGNDPDADQLLEPALAIARYRVVVKRPRLAPDLNGQTPTYRLEGKSCRYDIHTIKAFDATSRCCSGQLG
ncbi:class I SAM-dependent methyltransferase [Endozoicomonas sp. SCSIO W0465]|uniref:class I SAM-dependent methyltransferase n=1 Tax=Endozoicomonas sp. SCSIO W0465 TaxID=2918516 RepID=UPI0020756EA7|nr:class I SAM-dependent methyltransferase [Endozoicomonas sp. SCSIO W0465]USE38363.1 class I SAM-dependent methyltransferase [Endozoicomonas sp. SCSIO W0465]